MIKLDKQQKRYHILTLLIFHIISFSFKPCANAQKVTLDVYLEGAKHNDSLVLIIGSKYLRSYDDNEAANITQTADENGVFKFSIPVKTHFGFWQLNKKSSQPLAHRSILAITQPFFWEVGDSIHLVITNHETITGIHSSYKFSGKGSEKYILRKNIESFGKQAEKETPNSDPDKIYYVHNSEVIKKVFDYIDRNRQGMSDFSVSILKTEQVYNYGRGPYTIISNLIKDKQSTMTQQQKVALMLKTQEIFSGRKLMEPDSLALASTVNSLRFIIYGLQTESRIKYNVEESLWIYTQIKMRYSGILRDELLAYQLSFEKNDVSADSLFKDAFSIVKSESARRQLLSVKDLYRSKDFPSYHLYDHQGKVFHLNQLRNKVIVFDFWFTGCAQCFIFYKEVLFNVEQKYLNSKDVVFVSVCLDKFKEKWLKSLSLQQYSGAHAINLWTGGKGFLLPLLTDNNIQGCPTVMLVDSRNKLKYVNTSQLFKTETLISSIESSK